MNKLEQFPQRNKNILMTLQLYKAIRSNKSLLEQEFINSTQFFFKIEVNKHHI